MQDQFQIILPATVSEKDLKAIQAELNNIDGIVNAGRVGTRGVDASSLNMLFNIATAVFSVAGVLLPLAIKIKRIIKPKKISATLKLPDGTEIALESTTVEDIEQILKTLEK